MIYYFILFIWPLICWFVLSLIFLIIIFTSLFLLLLLILLSFLLIFFASSTSSSRLSPSLSVCFSHSFISYYLILSSCFSHVPSTYLSIYLLLSFFLRRIQRLSKKIKKKVPLTYCFSFPFPFRFISILVTNSFSASTVMTFSTMCGEVFMPGVACIIVTFSLGIANMWLICLVCNVSLSPS